MEWFRLSAADGDMFNTTLVSWHSCSRAAFSYETLSLTISDSVSPALIRLTVDLTMALAFDRFEPKLSTWLCGFCSILVIFMTPMKPNMLRMHRIETISTIFGSMCIIEGEKYMFADIGCLECWKSKPLFQKY